MMRVLIVDDNLDLAENIAEILQFDGHITEVATSGEEALPLADRVHPEVVITDYRLPGINGAALLRLFRQRTSPFIRTVVISAYTDEGTMNEAKEAGATFLPKPIDFGRLCRLVADCQA
ncbi:MAG TPA: response regulator [Polyangia bacterium]|jgi:CheY-like chemotaxis protein